MSKQIALVLSGGGGKGAFQVGAERYAREVKGYRWSIIAGVSIGALNGAFIAMGRQHRLLEVWQSLTPEKLFGRSKRHAIHILRQLMLRKPSLYGNEPIREIIEREIDPSAMAVDFRVGVVSLISGRYRVFRKDHPGIKDAILASAALPPIFPPVDVGQAYPAMVDGGVRKVSPIGDVLDARPDELVIINCNPHEKAAIAAAPKSALGISQRAFGISMHQVFENDVKKFLLLNDVVGQAEAAGLTLAKPDGRPYRRYPYVLIEPDERTGDTTDVTPAHIRRAMDAGWEKAKKVLG
jgi:NTE family protein